MWILKTEKKVGEKTCVRLRRKLDDLWLYNGW